MLIWEGLSSYDVRSLSLPTSVSDYDVGCESCLDYKDTDNSGSDEKESDEVSNDHVDSEVCSECGFEGSDEYLVN